MDQLLNDLQLLSIGLHGDLLLDRHFIFELCEVFLVDKERRVFLGELLKYEQNLKRDVSIYLGVVSDLGHFAELDRPWEVVAVLFLLLLGLFLRGELLFELRDVLVG